MSEQQPGSIGRFLGGVCVGIAMTWGYVRFGLQLPGVVQLPAKVTSAAISITADNDLENWELPIAVRQRAAAVIFAQNPQRLIEIDDRLNHAILTELWRTKAVRRAEIAVTAFDAYDRALAQPALRQAFERRYNTTDTEHIKQCLLEEAICEDAFLRGYLAEHWPAESTAMWSRRVLNVYESELRPPLAHLAAQLQQSDRQ